MSQRKHIIDSLPVLGYDNKCIISKEKGCYTLPINIELKEFFTSDDTDMENMNLLFENIIEILGPNYLIHKQDSFIKETIKINKERIEKAQENNDFLTEANEKHFSNFNFNTLSSTLYITKTPKNYFKYSPKRVNSFLKKTIDNFLSPGINKTYYNAKEVENFKQKTLRVINLINESQLIKASLMTSEEVVGENGVISNYLNLGKNTNVTRSISFENDMINIGEKRALFFTVEETDQLAPTYQYGKEYTKFSTKNTTYPVSNLFNLGFHLEFEHIINQYIYIVDPQVIEKTLSKRERDFNRFSRNPEDPNAIYAYHIKEFKSELVKNHKIAVLYHMNVMCISEDKTNFQKIIQDTESAFKSAKINATVNNVDRQNLFWAGFPGNGIGVSAEMYIPMQSELACALLYLEGAYKDSMYNYNGMRVTDRIQGVPLYLDLYREMEKNQIIYNRNIVILSGSGGGKSYVTNHYLYSEYILGSHISILDAGKSYTPITEVLGGSSLEHSDKNPFTFNPFLLDKYDYQLKSTKLELSEGKIIFLFSLINIITGGGYENVSSSDEQLKYKIKQDIIQKAINGYYQSMHEEKREDFKFDTFYKFIIEFIPNYIHDKKIRVQLFDSNAFISLLEVYTSGNLRGELLNKQDDRFKNLSYQRMINFEVDSLIDNDILFPICALLVMDLFTKKLNDESIRHINKIIAIDESWAALDKKELEEYLLYLVKTARKKGGQTIFISQEAEDFVKSKVIANSIINNSDIKIFLDMSKYKNDFDNIQNTMGITEKQKQHILSINKDNREESKYREACVCWKDISKVYAIETSKVEKCMYETNPNERKKIHDKLIKFNNNWELTALDYAS